MADESYILGQSDLAEQLFRILGLRGDLPRLVRPELLATIQVDDFTQPEYRWTRRTALYFAGFSVSAVAAQFGSVALQIPSGQRGVTVVESIIITNNNAAAQNFRFAIAYPAAIGYVVATSGVQRDDRLSSPSNSFTKFGQGNNVGKLLGGGPFVGLPAGASQVIPVNAVLTGNSTPAGNLSAFIIECDIVNTSMLTGIIWRERAALASELS